MIPDGLKRGAIAAVAPSARRAVAARGATHGPVAQLSLVLFCVYMATGMVSALIPLRVAAVTHDYGELAAITTVYAGTGILAGYGWGWLADRLGRRTPFVLSGLLGVALAYAAYLLARSFAALVLTRGLEGAALAAYNVGSVALLGDYLAGHPNRGRLLGAYRTLGSLAFGLTMLTSGMVADWLGPLVPFLCSAAFALVGSLLALGLRDAPPAPTAVEPAVTATAATGDRHSARAGAAAGLLACLLAGAFGWHLILTAVYSVWPNYLASLGYSPAAITRLWALASLSEVPFMAVTGALADRIGRRPMLVLALGTIGLVVLGYLALPDMPWIAVVQVVRAVAWSAFLTASLALTVEVSSYAQRGRVTGLVNTVGAVGDVTGAAAGGTLVRAGGFTALLYSGGAAAFVCAGLVLLTGVARFVRPRRRTLGMQEDNRDTHDHHDEYDQADPQK